MKIVYCNHSVYNPGGMERVLYNKAVFLAKAGWEVTVVTTDQSGRPAFYPFPDGIRMIDLDINYSVDNDKGAFRKITGYLRKKRLHRKRLEKVLMELRPDIVVSLYPSESSFIPKIKDGSKKVLEFHYCKFFRLQYARKGLLGMIDKWRTREDEKIVSRFDRFVTLTEEDRNYWGAKPNMLTIPNAAMRLSDKMADSSAKRVIAVGRLDYQKGFDRLIEAWSKVQADGRFADWHLDIFGQGEWKEMLQQKIDELGLKDTATINPPTKNIAAEYASSSIMAMTSHYEGFPMVMIEAMAQGVPVVTMDYKCGPRDIIQHGQNGMIVPEGNIEAFAQALKEIMADDDSRKKMGMEARKVADTYSEAIVMKKWTDLFTELTSKE